jgi:hypothetical protein
LKCLYIRIASPAITITGTTDTRIVSNRPSIDATGIIPSFIGYDYYQDTIIPLQRHHGKRFDIQTFLPYIRAYGFPSTLYTIRMLERGRSGHLLNNRNRFLFYAESPPLGFFSHPM